MEDNKQLQKYKDLDEEFERHNGEDGRANGDTFSFVPLGKEFYKGEDLLSPAEKKNIVYVENVDWTLSSIAFSSEKIVLCSQVLIGLVHLIKVQTNGVDKININNNPAAFHTRYGLTFESVGVAKVCEAPSAHYAFVDVDIKTFSRFVLAKKELECVSQEEEDAIVEMLCYIESVSCFQGVNPQRGSLYTWHPIHIDYMYYDRNTSSKHYRIEIEPTFMRSYESERLVRNIVWLKSLRKESCIFARMMWLFSRAFAQFDFNDAVNNVYFVVEKPRIYDFLRKGLVNYELDENYIYNQYSSILRTFMSEELSVLKDYKEKGGDRCVNSFFFVNGMTLINALNIG